jgi:hypothetical protein
MNENPISLIGLGGDNAADDALTASLCAGHAKASD